MKNVLKIHDIEYSIEKAELHLPLVDDIRIMYMMIQCGSNEGGFAIWEIELGLLEKIDDLDGKRIHVKPNGETYDDDTLGTDIIGADILTDLNYWQGPGDEDYCYGDIKVDFERINGSTYRVRVECSLTDSDDNPDELPSEAFKIIGKAEFTVTVDEKNPMEIII